jgi:hypothetical protein
VRLDRAPPRIRVGATELNSGSGLGGPYRHGDASTGMQSDPHEIDRALNRTLMSPVRDCSILHTRLHL